MRADLRSNPPAWRRPVDMRQGQLGTTWLDACRPLGDRGRMNELLVGYARVSTEQQDLSAQRIGLNALGVGDDRIYVDHGLTGANRDRPGLRLALAACRAGDTLVVTKLDRLARSLPDARDILDELTRRNVKLSLGGFDPTDPVGRLLFNVLAMVAEFESDLIRLRTREGMKVAKAKGRLRGKKPKLKPNQAKHLLELHDSGTYTQAELAELFGVGRSTIYRTIERMRPKSIEPERPFVHRAIVAEHANQRSAEISADRVMRP
jgi:DNA invertase Pin-like site-specific DNA recombinase